MRVIAGFGLAGELGAGITLVTEILPKEKRGYGTTLVAIMGVLGALLAYLIAHFYSWRTSYFFGGGLGLVLMVMRIRVFESGIFMHLKDKNIRRGDIGRLFNNKKRFLKYLNCILVGMPVWFVLSILITLSPEFARALGISEPIDASKTVMLFFAAQVLGNIVSGSLSQYFQSRKKVIFIYIFFQVVLTAIYLFFPSNNSSLFYLVCSCLGFFNGYFPLFITTAAELFGSDLRATVSTTASNFVRGSVILQTMLFASLKSDIGTIHSAMIVALIVYAAALLALFYLEETFKKDLNYVEGQ
jgi:MFS family permease